VCSPTRATILTGKYGIRTGVLWPGDEISLAETSLQSFINTNVPNTYNHAVIGKWHLAGRDQAKPGYIDNPNLMGIDYFAGLIGGGVGDYFSWPLVENGQSSDSQDYTTTAFVDLTIDWIAGQQGPWFAWLAFNAPHTPFHLPPLGLHDRDTLSADQAAIDADPRPYYLAMIEAMDREIGRLLASFSAETRANTVIIYIGDNGTPRQVIQGHVPGHGKGSVYEGGVAVPLIVSGRGVTRTGERESALVSSVDLFATIAALAGTGTEEFNDSKSFAELLSNATTGLREYAYTEIKRDMDPFFRDDWAIRNDRYKLIQRLASEQELYDLEADPFEQDNLLANGSDVSVILAELQAQANLIRQ
jgi:arylsulfatase A-like enzyme